LSVILLAAFLAACYFALTASAETPSAGKAKKAVAAADAATKKAQSAWNAVFGAAGAAHFGTKYPDNEDGRAATAADGDADAKDATAEAAVKAAAEAREKACKSGKAEDAQAADEAEKAAQEAETSAAAADAAADRADSKADPYGKQLQKKKRDAGRALRAAFKAAMAAICFARQCAQLMDESSESNKKKKEETIETIEGLNSSVDKLLVLAPKGGAGQVETAQGLRRIIFDTAPGRVTVNLPDDMRVGDRISGTVVEEPKGGSPDEREKNKSTLDAMVIDVGGTKLHASEAQFITNIEPGSYGPQVATGNANFVIENVIVELRSGPGDAVLGIAEVPITPGPKPPAVTTPDPKMTPFTIPPLGQTGRPFEIFGPFDGNSSNTTLRYGPVGSTAQDFEKNTENVSGGFGLIRPLAESPRKIVFESPPNLTGPVELNVKEGSVQSTGTCRNVGVRLTAPKTNLLKGERTILTVEVNGLQGIKKPVPLTLESKGVITMEGGMFQPLFIQPSQIGADGRYTTTRGITGVQTGGWTSTATLVTQPFNIVLRDPDPPQTILVNSFTGDYVFCGSGPKLTGTGEIKRAGCVLTLTDNRPDRRVHGTLDSCVPVDNGRLFTFYSAGTNTEIKVTVTDTQPPKKRIYFNPQSKSFGPIQDVSAFATCP